MCRSSPCLVPLALAMAANATCQSRAVPAHTAVADGHERFAVGSDALGFRWQILVDAGAIAPNGATLHGLAFRSDERQSWPGTALTNVSIALSHTPAAAAGMSTTFANNVAGPATTVFQGTVTFPGASTALAGPSPWDVVVQFPVPYGFSAAQGNLLIEITKPGPSGSWPVGYFLDSVCGGGSATRVGVAGASASPLGAPSLSCGAPSRTLTTGNTIPFASTWGIYPNPPLLAPGVIALGLAAQPTPIDLAALGAPGNFVYIDPQVLATHGWTLFPLSPWTATWLGSVSVAVPNHPALVGTMLYAQAVGFDPPANALGIVLGNAVEVRIGDASEQLPLRMLVGAFGGASGSFLSCAGPGVPDHGALALRLDGSFF